MIGWGRDHIQACMLATPGPHTPAPCGSGHFYCNEHQSIIGCLGLKGGLFAPKRVSMTLKWALLVAAVL